LIETLEDSILFAAPRPRTREIGSSSEPEATQAYRTRISYELLNEIQVYCTQRIAQTQAVRVGRSIQFTSSEAVLALHLSWSKNPLSSLQKASGGSQ